MTNLSNSVSEIVSNLCELSPKSKQQIIRGAAQLQLKQQHLPKLKPITLRQVASSADLISPPSFSVRNRANQSFNGEYTIKNEHEQQYRTQQSKILEHLEQINIEQPVNLNKHVINVPKRKIIPPKMQIDRQGIREVIKMTQYFNKLNNYVKELETNSNMLVKQIKK
ncbi:Hypothetical_protein [Hexamita inflata]|uniref:Hypothetical_protein n=1 Tax=Hexamita inflata TaxID=28002 RepID=A0AA86N5M8_9EUKA|nr:Hypothetical protein HINF_LOCUS928 [Hexamita inflata]